MKIKEFTAGKRFDYDIQLLVYQVKEGVTNSGSPYLTVTLKDSTGTIDGKIWSVTSEQKEAIKIGQVMKVKGDVITYSNNLQLKIAGLMPVNQNEVDMSEFVTSGPYTIAQLKEKLNGLIESIRDTDLHTIVRYLYDKYEDEIYHAPAATRFHHEYVSGLATHVYSMAVLAEQVARQYPTIDRDLLISGVLVHDLGKMIEMKMTSVTEYTLEGNLLGHISIAQAMIAEAAEQLGLNSEKIILLRHLILSHHGKYEFGSPVLPKTIEAVALSTIDDLDAKMNMLEKELAATAVGSNTGRLMAFENRAFYKHEGNSKDE